MSTTTEPEWVVYQCENQGCEAFQGHWVKKDNEDNSERLCPECGEPGLEVTPK